jgi:small GTP-binding protein
VCLAARCSNDQERERGITILAKNAALVYEGTKVNIVDTPGHADFGGEVERVLGMVDGVLLLVDAAEGPKPQTRFVLKKALSMGHRILVVVNKIDKPAARPEYVIDKTFDLFCELGASDEQTDFPIVYTSAINRVAGLEPDAIGDDMSAIFNQILVRHPIRSHHARALTRPMLPSRGADATAVATTADASPIRRRLSRRRRRRAPLRSGWMPCAARTRHSSPARAFLSTYPPLLTLTLP